MAKQQKCNCPASDTCRAIPNGKMCSLIRRKYETIEQPSGCDLCKAEWIDIEVQTTNPDNTFLFSSDVAVGLRYCPLCGRKL